MRQWMLYILKTIPLLWLVALMLSMKIEALGQSSLPQNCSVDANFGLYDSWFSAPFRVNAGIRLNRHRISGQFGWSIISAPTRQWGVEYQYSMAGRKAHVIDPYLTASFVHDYTSRTPIFFYYPSKTIGFEMGVGARWYYWNGFYLFGQGGFGISRVIVPDFHHFIEDPLWVKPSFAWGMGYCYSIRPRQGLRPDFEEVPKELPSGRHSLSLLAGRAVFFLFRPELEYRVQYGYTAHPLLDVYGGVDLSTTRWLLRVGSSRDSVQVMGGRGGVRFYPMGRGTLQCYGDVSLAFGRRFMATGSALRQGSSILRFTTGSGLKLKLWRELYGIGTFFYTIYWVFPNQLGTRQGESGVDVGLSYMFGGRKKVGAGG